MGITSEKIFKLVETFESILLYAQHEGALNMMETTICEKEKHHCGSIHCHAGWYWLAKKWDRETLFLPRVIFFSFSSGVDLMEEDLGCKDVEYWGFENSEIWGNRFSNCIFNNEKAFTSPDRPKGAKTLQDIVDHWGEVGMRLLIEELYLEGSREEKRYLNLFGICIVKDTAGNQSGRKINGRENHAKNRQYVTL